MIKVFAGTNFYLIKSSVDQIKNDFIDKYGDMSVEEIDCEDIETDTILNSLNSTPLFVTKKLVIAKNIAKNKELSGQVEQIIKAAVNSDEFIIVEKDIDKRGSYYKFLKKNTDFTECNEPDENQLAEWLCQEAKALSAEISRQDAKYLISRVGLGQQMLSNEIKKLANYNRNITRSSIDELTSESPQSSVFNLLEAAFSGNSKLAIKLYEEQKIQGSEPQSIFGMLVWQANIIATTAAGANMSTDELARTTGLKPFSISKANNIYRRMGRKGVAELLDKLIAADKQMKTNSVDPDETLKNLLVTIS